MILRRNNQFAGISRVRIHRNFTCPNTACLLNANTAHGGLLSKSRNQSSSHTWSACRARTFHQSRLGKHHCEPFTVRQKTCTFVQLKRILSMLLQIFCSSLSVIFLSVFMGDNNSCYELCIIAAYNDRVTLTPPVFH